MRKIIPILSMLFMFTYSLLGQTTTVSLPDTTAIKGSEVLIPVQLGASLSDVGAVTLKISFNSDAVDFVSIENNNLIGGSFLTNLVGDNQINVAWTNLSDPVDLEKSIFDIKFAYKQGTSELKFVGENEVADGKGDKIPVTFVNGQIAPLPVQVGLSKEVGAVGDTVVVEVSGAQLENIGSMNLYIGYSEASAKFLGIGEVNLPGFIAGTSTNKVNLGMANVSGYSHTSGVMATLLFEVVAGTTDLTLDVANSIVQQTDFTVIPVVYTNGSVSLIDGTLALGSITTKVGETVSVPLYAYDAVNVGSFNIDVSYDKDVLTFVSIDGGIIANDKGGTISLAYANSTGLTADGKIADLVFTLDANASSNVSFVKSSANITDVNYNALNFDLVNGMVSVDATPYFTVTLPDTTIAAEATLEFQYVGMQDQDEALVFGLVSGPEGAAITEDGAFSWTSSYESPESNEVVVSLTSAGITVIDTAVVTVEKTNRAPEFTKVLGPTSWEVADWESVETLTFQYEATDPDGDDLAFSLSDNLGGQASINATGLFTFTPKKDAVLYPSKEKQEVDFDAIVTVSDASLSVSDTSTITVDVTTDVIPNVLPTNYALEQNYPNPFNPTSTIRFALPKQSNVKIAVYNMLGQQVATLANSELAAGIHTVKFNAVNLSSGIYLYNIKASAIDGSKEFTSVKKMMLMK